MQKFCDSSLETIVCSTRHLSCPRSKQANR